VVRRANGEVVGRIFKVNAAPVGSRTPTHGYAATREDAMAALPRAGGANDL